MRRNFFLFVISLGLLSCNQREESRANADLLYFDIKGYFADEAVRLTKINPKVIKAVYVNGALETKTLKISDWKKELDIFASADINKTSWKGSFKAQNSPDAEHYTSSSKKIPVKDVLIEKANGKIKKIQIVTSTKNILFTSGDTLTYYPDSLYQIIKHQKTKLLSAKNYKVTGRF